MNSPVAQPVESESESGLYSLGEEAVEAFRSMERASEAILQTIRMRSAPPDGRNREIMPIGIGEAAERLGVSVSLIRKREDEFDTQLNRTKGGTREFYPDDIYRLRRFFTPRKNPGRHVPSPVIAVANQKGGVGKTTTTLSLAQELAWQGKRVLVIDMDNQSSITASLLIESEVGSGRLVEGTHADLKADSTISPILTGQNEAGEEASITIRDLIRKTHWPSIDIIPAMPDLIEAEFSMINMLVTASGSERAIEKIKALLEKGKISEEAFNEIERVLEEKGPMFWGSLRSALSALSVDEYDVVLIDTAPSLGLLTVVTLLAAHGVLVPCPARNLDIESLRCFMRVVGEWTDRLRVHHPLRLKFVRLVTTMLSTQSKVELRNDSWMRRVINLYLPHYVPRNEALQRSSGSAPTVYERQPKNKPSWARSAKSARETLQLVYEPINELIEAVLEEQGAGYTVRGEEDDE